MSGALWTPRDTGQRGFFENVATAWMQDTSLARTGEDAIERLNRWGAAMRPAPVQGYSPYRGNELDGMEDSLHLFVGSQSPEETAYIRERVMRLRQRASELDESGAFFSRFVAALGDPLNFVGPAAGLGRNALTTAGRFAAAGAAAQVPISLLDQAQLPGQAQGDMMTEVAFAGLLSGALGPLAYNLSRRSLDGAVRRHMAANEAYDGLTIPRDPGAPMAPRRADAGEPPAAANDDGPPAPPIWRPADAGPAPRAANDDVPGLEILGEDGRWVSTNTPAGQREMQALIEQRLAFSRELMDERRWPDARLRAAAGVDGPMEGLIERELERRGFRSANDNAGGPTAPRWAPEPDETRAAIDDAAVTRGVEEPRGVRLANENEPGEFRRADDVDPAPGAPTTRTVEAAPDRADPVATEQAAREAAPGASPVARGAEAPTPAVRADAAPAAAPVAARAANDTGPASSAPPGDVAPPAPPERTPPAANDQLPPGDGVAVDVNRIGGFDKILGATAQFPYWLLKANRFTGQLRRSISLLADDLAQTPLRGREGNEAGLRTATESVEAASRQWLARYAEASNETFRLYAQYRGWGGAWSGQVGGRLRTMAEGAAEAVGVRQGPELSFGEFREAIFSAIHRGKAEVPEVAEAARIWTERVFEPIGEEAARHGVLLLHKHRDLARAAVERELAGRAVRLREADDLRYDFAGFTTPEQKAKKRREIGRWLNQRRQANIDIEATQARLEREPGQEGYLRSLAAAQAKLTEAEAQIELFNRALDALVERTPEGRQFNAEFRDMREAQAGARERLETLKNLPDRGTYLPHVHNHRAWRAAGDEGVQRVGRHFSEQQPETTWASPMVRAEIAVGHILGESAPDLLQRAIRRTFMESGMDGEAAAARAAPMVDEVRRVLAEIGPNRLATEVRSALGMKGPEWSRTPLVEPLVRAMEAANVASNDMDRFVRELLNAGAARDLDNLRTLSDAATDRELGDFTRPGHARQRKMQVPTALIEDYLDRDILDVALEYSRAMGRAIEMGRKMGDPSMLGRLERLQIDTMREVTAGRASIEDRAAAITAARDLRDMVLGHFMIPEDPSAISVRSVTFLRHVAILTQMGGAIFANIMDTGRLIMAVGFRRTFGGIIDELAKSDPWRGAGDEAEKAGAAVELATLQVQRAIYDTRDVGADRIWVERAAARGVPAMFFLNLVAPWTQMMQRVAGGIIQSDMVELSTKVVAGTASAAERTRLAQLGVDEQLAGRITEQWRVAGGQTHGRLFLANTDAWLDGDLRNRFRASLTTAVDQAVTKPGAADIPAFMSAPLAKTILLYRGFAMSFAQRAILAGIQQRDAMVLSGAMATLAIAYLTQQQGPVPQSVVNWDAVMERDTKRGTEGHLVDTGRLYGAIERSGLLSLFGDLNRMVEVASGNTFGIRPALGIDPPAYARDPNWGQRVGEIGGPAISPWAQALWAFTSEEAKGSQMAGAMRRLLPFNNLLWWDGAFRALGTEVGAAIGNPQRNAATVDMPGYAGGR